MKSSRISVLSSVVAISLVASFPGMAQDSSPAAPPPAGGWHRFQPTTPQGDAPQDAGADPAQAQPPAPAPAPPPAPSKLTIPAGTWVTIRVNEPLSSDHNQAGDAFFATLAQPLVVDGYVVARRGQQVSGVISEAQKAGRVSGTSHLGLELTEVGLADGHQVQVKSKLVERRGPTSVGRDAFAIGATTATGAAIGAAVNGGVGAGVGAGAGLVVSTIGVLLTRGRPTIVYPETPLTFRLETPVTIDANYEAFLPAAQQQPAYGQGGARGPAYGPGGPGGPGYGPGPGYGYGPGAPPPPPPYYGYYAPYPYAYGYPYPYFWGPTVVFRGGFGGFRRW
jgi:hypothetical protein